MSYTLTGQYSSILMPNGQYREHLYDDQGRLLQVAQFYPPDSELGTFDYAYDLNHTTGQWTMLGQRVTMTSNGEQTKYFYDDAYQLRRTDYPSEEPFNSEVHEWTYDAIGNRLTKTINSVTQNYTYYLNDAYPLNGQRLQSDGTNTYTYDYNGNLTSDGTFAYTWDADNRLASITGGGNTITYKYDHLGRRYTKATNGSNIRYIYDGQNLIAERWNSVADYLFGPDR